MRIAGILCNVRLVLEWKAVKQMPELSRLEFLEKFSANSFALSEAENNASGPLGRGRIANLPLLRILLTILQKSQQPSFLEKIDSFVILA